MSLLPNPVDPFGMADLGFASHAAQAHDTISALIKRRSYHFTRFQVWRLQNTLITQPETMRLSGPVSLSEPE